MSLLDNLLTKIIRLYNNYKKDEIKSLEKHKDTLLNSIEKENNNKVILEQEKDIWINQHKSLENSYIMLIEILKNQGVVFEIPNRVQEVEEWDNLVFKYINSKYYFVNKNREIVCEVEDKYKEAIRHIVDNYKYSLLVIRKDKNKLKLQLRIILSS
ncbi:hypothetical protein KQI89_05125 [Clostridium sp. MSJ-4]|uniref:Uncharacterized protein n=1 Tax=Clostridium simiarum TaxID=2841506 RepID=A0ABS6EY48_9CLOT|nr:hypothetical protein [Clostridium simiarum]MBU5591139.1 hypothetical protein [Clostridium simiarum]